MEKEHLNDEDEQQHFERIVKSFKAYKHFASKRVSRPLAYFNDLSQRQKDYVPDFESNCRVAIKCVDENYEILKLIIKDVDDMFLNKSQKTDEENKKEENSDGERVEKNEEIKLEDLIDGRLNADIDRVYTTLKQIVRDWSFEGAAERNSCYYPILSELKSIFPSSKKETEQISVLVPGAGLGRLAFEIARLGFRCQGNEFSLHMLITSNFILNKCYETDQYTIYPYVHSWCNNLKFSEQTRAITFPDISPFESMNDLFQFSMTAGDFLDVYQDKNEWNCVVTCFFIDTAHNVIDYIEKIYEILKPGGYWINLGPLLYHYSEMVYERSVELSYEQIRNVIEKVGFKYQKEELNHNSKYIDNKFSMLRYMYNCVFFVVQKPSS